MSRTSSGPALADDEVLALEDVSLRYGRGHGRPPLLQEYATRLFGGTPLERAWALRDVTLRVRRGEVLGLVGANGSGKSTLLKVVARILRPSAGRLLVRGRVAPLIELGAGFQPDLTGRENILLKSAILGFDEHDARRRTDRILDFAGLHAYVDSPLRTYSSGMVARLAFATATDVRPDVLLLDEVLAVGDAEFRERSEARISELRQAGTTIVVVAHQTAALRRLCDRVAWLAHGSLQLAGDPARVIRAYEGGAQAGDAADFVGAAEPTVAVELGPEEKLFVLETPASTPPQLTAAIERQFDERHICPMRARGELPPRGRVAVAPYRLLRGAYFYDQAAQLLQRPPVCATVLRDPLARAAAEEEIPTVDNRVTRMLGQRIPPALRVPDDKDYLARPVTPADHERARETLAACAFVGLAERPRESLLLLWYAFGWSPDRALPPDEPSEPPQAGIDREAIARRDALDLELYAHACRLFDERYELMARDLIDRYAHAHAEELHPPFPIELVHGLLRQHSERRRATGPRPLRFTFDRPVPGGGWYGVEYNPQHGTFRWTGPEPTATLQLPLTAELADRDLTLQCRVLRVSRPSVLRSLRLSVNGRQVALTQTRRWDGSVLCEAAVPRASVIGSPFVNIALDVGQTYQPEGTEHRDTRRLGVALSWIELAPLSEGGGAPS
ncbi:MAG: hypothetical protein RLZZ387_1583 [Chloroflexota bacterium]